MGRAPMGPREKRTTFINEQKLKQRPKAPSLDCPAACGYKLKHVDPHDRAASLCGDQSFALAECALRFLGAHERPADIQCSSAALLGTVRSQYGSRGVRNDSRGSR